MISVRTISVTRETLLVEAQAVLDRVGTGVLMLIRSNGTFERTVTDGDLRRLMLGGCKANQSLSQLPELEAYVINDPFSRREALTLMNHHQVNCLPVLNAQGQVTEVLARNEIDQPILLSTPHMGDDERYYVEEAFRTNWIAPLGPNVDSFEREMAELVGVKYAAAVSSGTAAIHVALRILGVRRGDRVFCSTLTFAASANPIEYLGAKPVFIDSDSISWNMSSSALEAAFRAAEKDGRLPKAVIVVNLYGQSADMYPLLEICNRYEVPVVEDAAESLGARYRGQASGTFGKIGIYSFNGNKIITTSSGGMLVSDDSDLIERAQFLSTQARDPALHYQHSEIGYNYRMSNILAGVGRGQLKVLRQRVLARRAVFQRYRESLAEIDAIVWMPEPEWGYSTHWLSACTLNSEVSNITPADVIAKLATEMIEARPVWKPMHMQPVFNSCCYFEHSTGSVSEGLFARGLCLPSGSNLSLKSQDRIIDTLRRIFN